MEYVVLALATWRMSRLLVREEGPWMVFARMRHVAGIHYDARSQVVAESELARVFNCVWCMSVWVALGWTAAYTLAPWTIVLALPLALSAGAVLLEEATSLG